MFDFINKNDLVFDVGANMGLKANRFLEYTDNVVCFEPQAKCIPSLEMLGVKIENIALSDEVGEAKIYLADAHTITSMSEEFIKSGLEGRFKDNSWNESETVPTNTLDNMILKYGKPKFIKIDVEGYELQVLKGLHQPIEYISIEFTPELCKKTVECIDYLPDSLYNYVSQENDEFYFKDWVTKSEIIEFVQSIHDYKVEFGDIYIKYDNR